MTILVKAEFTIFYPKVSQGIVKLFSIFDFSESYEGISFVPTPFYQSSDFQIMLFIVLSIVFSILSTFLSILAIRKRQHSALPAAGAFISILTTSQINIYLSIAVICITIISIHIIQRKLKHAA